MSLTSSTMRHRAFFILHFSFFIAIAANAATPISPGGVFRAGQTAALSIGAADDAWCVLDAAAYPSNEVVVASGEATGSMLRIAHNMLGGKLGAYVLRSWRSGGSATNETRFAFIPPGDVRPVPWVGTQFHYRRDTWGGGDERLLDLAAEAGIGIVRDSPRWAGCETTPGVYSMPEAFESFVNGLVRRDMKLLCHLTYQNETAYPDNPFDATAFANWAAWTADHFAGRVDTYEIWNEPHNFYYYEWYTNTIEQCGKTSEKWISHFAQFTRAADDALAGRGLRVGVGSEDWSEILYTMIEQGIARPRNYLALHPYDHGVRPEKGKWLKDDFADLRSRLAANGASGAGVAITELGWSTYVDETGTADYAPATFAEQARYLVRMYLVANAGGVEFASQYDFKDDGTNPTKREHNWGMLDYWGRPKPSYAAVAAMTRFVGDATFIEELSTDPSTYRIQHFRNADGADIYVIWSVEGDRKVMTAQEIRTVLKPTDDTCYDMYGNKVATPRNGRQVSFTEDPVYMVAGASFAEAAEWGPPWLVPATSEPTLIYANARESLLWHTTPFGGTTVRWDKPATATNATLTVTCDGSSRTYSNLTGESCEIALPGGAATADGEDVVTLTLAFDDGTVRTAYLGAVTGLGSGGSAMAAPPRNVALPSWAKFHDRAVVAIPFGAKALTVNGEPLPGLDGSAGWRSIRRASGVGDYDLSMSLDGEAEPLLTTLTAKAYATLFIVH